MRVALLALILGSQAAVAAAPPPVDDFIRRPSYSSARISPGGHYLAVSVDRGEQDVLVVLSTADLSLLKVNQLPDGRSVGSFYWTDNERLMFNAVKKVGSFAQPFATGEWFAVNANGDKPRPLIFSGTRDATQRSKAVGSESYSMLDPLPAVPGKVLMTASRRSGSDGVGTEIVELDTLSGRRKSLARAPRSNCQITLDQDKSPRFAVCYDDEDEHGNYDIHNELYRRESDGSWRLLNRSLESGKRLTIAGTGTDGRIFTLQSDATGTQALGTLDADSAAFTPLLHDPVSDVAGFVPSADNTTLIGAYTAAGKPVVTLFDEEQADARLYTSLAAAFPDQIVSFSSATLDSKQIIVSVRSDRNPGELYLYNRDSGEARFLMQNRPWLDKDSMASVQPFSFTNRDGMRLYGYLTIPHGSDGKNLPMIVNPHGGPMGPRDDWGFNWETQLLASRGYLVLQVNFRGSGGFGKAFQDMAYGQWASGIMNDIIDATRWAFEQGHADPQRSCIYGGSFGGYSAMMAPAREPDLYRCAFGYVGNYSAELQMKLSDTSKSESGMRYLLRAYGKTKAEQDAMSPIKHVANIRLPVYLAAGARDPRCPPEHTKAMFEALKNAGNRPEGMIIGSGEMHGFYKEENNLHLYTEMLNFFDRNIGSAAAAAVAASN